jgi:hypothetical protein
MSFCFEDLVWIKHGLVWMKGTELEERPGTREEDGGRKQGTTWLFTAKFDFLMSADGHCF